MKETVRIVDIKDVKVFNEAVKLAQTAARRAREDDSWLAACNSSLVSAFPWNWGDRNWLEVYTEALHAKKAAAMYVNDVVWVNPPEVESGIGDAGGSPTGLVVGAMDAVPDEKTQAEPEKIVQEQEESRTAPEGGSDFNYAKLYQEGIEYRAKRAREEELRTKVLEASGKGSLKSFMNTDSNGAKKNVKDIQFWGNGDTFKLISKASSAKEGWMKSTKAMEIPGVGCVVQVTTQQGDNVAEAVVFVPGTRVVELKGPDGDVVSRSVERDTNIL